MLDLAAPEHSVLREKVVEHIFLAELSRSLLLDLGVSFEVLRAEFDAFGYDLVIEANGVMRHIQLKATIAAGTRSHVDVQTALRDKLGGCVIWMYVDPKTLSLGPYLWLGGRPGSPLPDLGERAVRHTRGDKRVRPKLRRVPKGDFERFSTIKELVLAMFGPVGGGHDRLLADHLASRSREIADLIPGNLTWDQSARIAYMIDGYALAAAAELGDPYVFADDRRREAERTGEWQGTLLELWTLLFLEHRRDRIQSQGLIGIDVHFNPLPMLDELCAALAAAAQSPR